MGGVDLSVYIQGGPAFAVVHSAVTDVFAEVGLGWRLETDPPEYDGYDWVVDTELWAQDADPEVTGADIAARLAHRLNVAVACDRQLEAAEAATAATSPLPYLVVQSATDSRVDPAELGAQEPAHPAHHCSLRH